MLRDNSLCDCLFISLSDFYLCLGIMHWCRGMKYAIAIVWRPWVWKLWLKPFTWIFYDLVCNICCDWNNSQTILWGISCIYLLRTSTQSLDLVLLNSNKQGFLVLVWMCYSFFLISHLGGLYASVWLHNFILEFLGMIRLVQFITFFRLLLITGEY